MRLLTRHDEQRYSLLLQNILRIIQLKFTTSSLLESENLPQATITSTSNNSKISKTSDLTLKFHFKVSQINCEIQETKEAANKILQG